MDARTTVRKTGSKPITATRVAGSEPLKISIPIKPAIHPLAILFTLPLPHLYYPPYLCPKKSAPNSSEVKAAQWRTHSAHCGVLFLQNSLTK